MLSCTDIYIWTRTVRAARPLMQHEPGTPRCEHASLPAPAQLIACTHGAALLGSRTPRRDGCSPSARCCSPHQSCKQQRLDSALDARPSRRMASTAWALHVAAAPASSCGSRAIAHGHHRPARRKSTADAGMRAASGTLLAGERGAGADYLARLERLGDRLDPYVDGDRVVGLARGQRELHMLGLVHFLPREGPRGCAEINLVRCIGIRWCHFTSLAGRVPWECVRQRCGQAGASAVDVQRSRMDASQSFAVLIGAGAT